MYSLPHATLRPIGASLLLLTCLPACSTWQPGGPTPAAFVQTQDPREVRVVESDGSHLQVRAPTIQGDSLVGLLAAGLGRDDTTRRVALPLLAVQAVQVHKVSAARTLGLVGGLMALGFVIEKATCSPNDYVC